MGKKKKMVMIPFWGKKAEEEKTGYHNDISSWKTGYHTSLQATIMISLARKGTVFPVKLKL